MYDVKQTRNQVHFGFLDGIRGLSALYVLFFHVLADGKEQLTREHFLLNFVRFGHEAVVIFIVLSGFVLTIPLVHSSQLALRGGLKKFIARRARRILPGYYAALLLLPLYLSLVEFSKGFTQEGTNWQRIRELFLSGDMLSHLLLVQNISSRWAGSINPVLWSMATEWWIYFIFALILIPLWRRFGVLAALVASVLLAVIPTILLAIGFPTLHGFPYLVMAFAIGMISVVFLYSNKYESHPFAWSVFLDATIVLTFVVFLAIAVVAPSVRLNPETRIVVDLLLALLCGAFILKLCFSDVLGVPTTALVLKLKQFLEWKPIRSLGNFSYSLYLTHLVVLNILGTTLHLAPIQSRINISLDPMPVRMFVVIPFLLLFAYGFYWVFERPFLSQRQSETQ